MTKPRALKKIVSRETAQALIAMIEMGKARIFKEHTPNDGAVLTAVSASGYPIGIIGERYRYLFEKAMIDYGSGDGFFGDSQTTLPGAP